MPSLRLLACAAWALLAACPPSARAAELDISVTEPGGAAVEEAVVWLEPRDVPMPRHAAQTEIRQFDKRFIPLVTVVQTGTLIDFPNEDTVKHHVYSFSPAKSFEIQLYAGRPVAPLVFDKPGVVALGCNIHDWMQAFVRVVDSRWFGKTDARGRVKLARLPAGRYTLHLWHPFQRADVPAQELALRDGPSRTLALGIDLDPNLHKQRPQVEDGY
jgi:hypothetical protein